MTADQTNMSCNCTAAANHRVNSGTILVADDDPLARELVSTTLNNNGWNTIPARTGYEVLKIIKTKSVDALILDMRMPELDGYEVCLWLCRRGMTLPTLVITGCIGDMEPLNCLNVATTIQKPVKPRQLLEFVEDVLA